MIDGDGYNLQLGSCCQTRKAQSGLFNEPTISANDNAACGQQHEKVSNTSLDLTHGYTSIMYLQYMIVIDSSLVYSVVDVDDDDDEV